MSDTPRTDAALCQLRYYETRNGDRYEEHLTYIEPEFARDLERELARALRVVEAAKALADNCEEYEFDDGLGYAAQGMFWHDLDNAVEEWEAGR